MNKVYLLLVLIFLMQKSFCLSCHASFCYTATVYDTSGHLLVTFYNHSAADDSITTTLWNFADGMQITSSDSIVGHFYDFPGIFVPSLDIITVSGCHSFFSDTIRLGTSCDTTFTAVGKANNMVETLYPNPANSAFCFQLSQQPMNQSYFKLYDVFGKLVKLEIINSVSTIINRDYLQNGIYFWQLESDDKILNRGKVVFD